MLSNLETAGRRPIVVMAGQFWQGASEAGLANGLRVLGYVVQEVELNDYMLPTVRSLPWRLLGRLGRHSLTRKYQEAVINTCRTLRPVLFVTVKGTGLDRETVLKIKKLGASTVNYYPDVLFDQHLSRSGFFAAFDKIITTKSFQLDYLKRQREPRTVAMVHHGFSSQVHQPVMSNMDDNDYLHDCLYAGNHSSYKQQWLCGLAKLRPDLDIAVVGPQWHQAKSQMSVRMMLMGVRTGPAYAEMIQRSKINIALHAGPIGPLGWQDLVSTRTFEIPACKGFMLHIDNDEVRELFKPGEEIDLFSTPEELADKIDFYLARPQLRRKMTERAYARCVPAYSYEARAREIIEIVNWAA